MANFSGSYTPHSYGPGSYVPGAYAPGSYGGRGRGRGSIGPRGGNIPTQPVRAASQPYNPQPTPGGRGRGRGRGCLGSVPVPNAARSLPTVQPSDANSSPALPIGHETPNSKLPSKPFSAHFDPNSYGKPPEKGTGTTPFQVHIKQEAEGSRCFDHYQTITAMPAYLGSSTEELRLIDYTQGRKPSTASREIDGFGPSKSGESCSSTAADTATTASPIFADDVEGRIETQIKLRVKKIKADFDAAYDRFRAGYLVRFKEHQTELTELRAFRAAHQACVPQSSGDQGTSLDRRETANEAAIDISALATRILEGALQPDQVIERLAKILILPADTDALVHQIRDSSKTVATAGVTEDSITFDESQKQEKSILQAKIETLNGRLKWQTTLERIAKEQLKAALDRTSELENNLAEQENFIADLERRISAQETSLEEQTKELGQSRSDADATRLILLEGYRRLLGRGSEVKME